LPALSRDVQVDLLAIEVLLGVRADEVVVAVARGRQHRLTVSPKMISTPHRCSVSPRISALVSALDRAPLLSSGAAAPT
jgi:hypothetical protein